MFTARSDAYDLERTCRCCLRELARLVPLNKPHEDIDDPSPGTETQRSIGDLLMEFSNVQVNSLLGVVGFWSAFNFNSFIHTQFNLDDGLPQKVCRKCISSLKAAIVFRKICEESDVKLREYFGQHLHSVKEDKFEVYFVDDSCDSGDVSKFDADADYSYTSEQTADQRGIIENGCKIDTDEIKMDIRIDRVEENYRCRYDYLLHSIFHFFFFTLKPFIICAVSSNRTRDQMLKQMQKRTRNQIQIQEHTDVTYAPAIFQGISKNLPISRNTCLDIKEGKMLPATYAKPNLQ